MIRSENRLPPFRIMLWRARRRRRAPRRRVSPAANSEPRSVLPQLALRRTIHRWVVFRTRSRPDHAQRHRGLRLEGAAIRPELSFNPANALLLDRALEPLGNFAFLGDVGLRR